MVVKLLSTVSCSDECAALVKEVTQSFWEHYTADEPQHSDVHLLPYPITVDDCGEVTNLEEPWNVVSILCLLTI